MPVSFDNFHRPDSHYILLEKIDPSKTRTVALIRDFPQITIGRNLSANVILHDNAASRNHALIKLNDGVFQIVDLKSKFGTIVKIKKNLPLRNKVTLKYKHYLIELQKRNTENRKKKPECEYEDSSEEEEECKRVVLNKSKKISKRTSK